MSALEYELEYETEGEWEAELEGEEFLRAARRVARGVSPQALRRVGGAAARSALSAGLGTLGGPASSAIMGGLGALGLRELEGELEFEEELEGEEFVNPLRRIYPDALMEHMAHAAAEAESEAEAEAFIGALIPIAARLLPRIAPAVMRAAPGLIRGVAGATRTLRANPATRPLVRAVPTIVRRTVADMGRQSCAGRAVTPQRAVQTLARQTRQVLSSPQQCSRALQRNAAADRRYHQAAQAQPNRVAV